MLIKRTLERIFQEITAPIQPVSDDTLFRPAAEPRMIQKPKNDADLIVITMNLWHDWPRHRRLPDRLERFAQLVEQEGAQIVLLQESLRTHDMETHAWLADRLGMQAFYKRANGNRTGIGFEEGVAVLTSLPVRDSGFMTLRPSNEPFVRRVVLGVEIELDCSTCWAFSTHLGLLPAHNAAQLEHLRQWVTETSGVLPALIGGDFNAHETDQQIVKTSRKWIDVFRRLHPEKQAVSHSLRWPWGTRFRTQRLDYLFLKSQPSSWRILQASYLEQDHEPYSDHTAILVRLAPCSLN